jgi:YebC/PmpR family DNA-binding regulatory protein
MSGHSKWSQIKRQKGVNDAKRGAAFTKVARDITLAARSGGGADPDGNYKLRLAIEKARAVNMPADNIKRAIRRGTGEEEGVTYDEVTYEGYGPGGVAILVETLTDNKNRTVGEIRHMFGKHGGNLGAENSVAWMFDRKGYIVIEKSKVDEETLMAAALDAGADDLRDDGDHWEVISAPAAFDTVSEAVRKLVEPDSAAIAMLPKNLTKLEGKTAQQMMRLMDALDDHDDVQKVWSNFDIEEKEIEASLA